MCVCVYVCVCVCVFQPPSDKSKSNTHMHRRRIHTHTHTHTPFSTQNRCGLNGYEWARRTIQVFFMVGNVVLIETSGAAGRPICPRERDKDKEERQM